MCKINFCGTILYGKLFSLRKIFAFDGNVIIYRIKLQDLFLNNLNENIHFVSIIIAILYNKNHALSIIEYRVQFLTLNL